MQIAPNQAQVSNPQKIMQALKAALQQVVDNKGYVDLNKLVTIWPQVSQQFGINIPFQTVMQLIQQNPSLIEDLITQMGLAGITVNGQNISAEQLMQQAQAGNTASGNTPSPQANAPAGG